VYLCSMQREGRRHQPSEFCTSQQTHRNLPEPVESTLCLVLVTVAWAIKPHSIQFTFTPRSVIYINTGWCAAGGDYVLDASEWERRRKGHVIYRIRTSGLP
jgi:hypothetical protein